MPGTELNLSTHDRFTLTQDQGPVSGRQELPPRFVVRPENHENRQAAIAEFERDHLKTAGVSSAANPRVAELLFFAEKLIRSNEKTTASHLIRQALSLDSKNPEALKKMRCCLGQSELDKVQHLAIQKVLCHVEPTFENYAQLGKLLAENKEWDLAMEAFFEANLRVKDDGQGLFDVFKEMGNISVRRGDFEQAEEYYHKAFTLEPDSDILQVNLGTLAIQREDWGNAITRFRHALEINSANDKAWVGMALCHHKLGDLPMAQATVENALDINPANRTAVHLFASWSIGLSCVERAAQRLGDYLSLNESDTEMSLVLIHLFCHLQKYTLARIEIERALCFDPQKDELAVLHEQLNQITEEGL